MSERLMVVGDDGIPIPGGNIIGEGLHFEGHPHYPPGGVHVVDHNPDYPHGGAHIVDHNPDYPHGGVDIVDYNPDFPHGGVNIVDHNPDFPHGGAQMYDHNPHGLQRSAAPPADGEEEKEKE